MAGIRTDNTFEGGLSFDSDKQKLSKQQYLDSINGRLLYNKQGSISWENIEGNRFHIQLAPNSGNPAQQNDNYIPIGYAMYSKYAVIFLVDQDNGNSEIGLFNANETGIGQYKTLFNDINDPNGEQLNFTAVNQIEARPLEENNNIIRVYWVDGVKSDSNPPRVFTFDYDENLDAYDINSYNPVTDSVHSINIQAEINFGLIKYIKMISGNILSGSYKFVYRLRTIDGYASPWSPLTQRIDVTTDEVDSSNWNDYEMEGSGVESSKGIQLEVKGIDQRFDILQVAFIFYETPDVVADSRIFSTIDISSDIQIIDFVANGGTPLTTDDIAALYIILDGAKTLNFKDATNYYGNIKEGNLSFSKEEIDVVLAGLDVVPKIRDMRSDEVNNYGVQPNPNNGDQLNAEDEWQPPITHQSPTGLATINRPIHTGLIEPYNVENEYINYKGTQVSHLFKGYFRGETYRFGIVFYDKKGVPGFAYHLCDFKFPDQYETAFNWDRILADGTIDSNPGNTSDPLWVTNDFNHQNGDKVTDVQTDANNTYSELRILGLEFNGIDISSIKDKISMVKIVRVPRDATILYQGLNVPLTIERENNPSGKVLSPMNSIEHSWRNTDAIGSPLDGALATNTDPTKFVQESCRDFYTSIATGGYEYANLYRPDDAESQEEPASCVFAPDLEFNEQLIPAVQTADGLKIVSSCFTYPRIHDNNTVGKDFISYFQYGFGVNNSDGKSPADYPLNLPNERGPKNLSFEAMLKLYFTWNDYHDEANNPSACYPRYGEVATITGTTSFTDRNELGGFKDGFVSNFTLYNEVQSVLDRASGWDSLTQPGANDKNYSRSVVKQGAFYYRHGFYSGKGSSNAFAPILRHNKQASDYNFPLPGATSVISDATAQDIFLNSRSNAYGFLICNYYRPNNAPYGGLNFSALENNIFMDTGYCCPIGNTTFPDPAGDIINNAEVWGGDCYLDLFGMQMYYSLGWLEQNIWPDDLPADVRDDYKNNSKVTGSVGVVFPLESVFNHSMRNAPSDNNPMYPDNGASPVVNTLEGNAATIKATQWFEGLYYESPDIKLIEEMNINEVLLLEDIVKLFGTQPLFFDESLFLYPVRWRYTPNKIYGDPIDTWRIFLANDYNDLQGHYGAITSSSYIFDQIYSFQERAFGKLRAFNRTALLTPDQGNLTTGIGDALDGIDYISEVFGNQHQWSLCNSDKSLYWVDVDRQKIMRFAQDGVAPISDFRSMHDFSKTNSKYFIDKDNHAFTEGIQTVYDHGNNEVIFSFLREKFEYLDGSKLLTDKDFQLNDTLFYTIGSPGITIDITTKYNIFYICLNEGEDATLVINGASGRPILADTCYRVTGVNGVYSVEEVEVSEITPYRYNLVYSEDMNVFVHFYSVKARFWFSYNSFILSASYDAVDDNSNKMWLHDYGSNYGSYYGEVHKSLLKINTNDNAPLHKIFDSVRINSDRDDLFSYFVYETDEQNYWIYLPTFSQKAYKENICRYPVRWFQQPDRTRGKFLSMSWDIDNVLNEEIRISSVGINYRLSNRI